MKHVDTRSRSRTSAWRHLATLLCLFALSGCDGEMPTGGDGEEDEEVELGGITSPLSLVNHRTVEVENWTYPTAGGVAKSSTRVPALGSSYLTLMLQACSLESRQLSVPTIPTTSTCKNIRSPIVPSGLAWPMAGPVTATAAVCAGHWALTVAEGTQPIYMGEYYPTGASTYFQWIGLKPNELPEPLKAIGVEHNPANLKVRSVLKPPSPTDAATWALLATELFREAAVLSAQLLDPAQCPPADINKTLTTARSNESINLQDLIASTLVDSTQSMIEASEKAQQLVMAAAAYNRGSAFDLQSAATREWRGRSNSRLEAANMIVPVSEYVFQERASAALWAMLGTDYSSYYYSTMPELPHAATGTSGNYLTQQIIGWVQSPDYPPVGPVQTLYSYRKANGIVVTTDQPLSWSELGTGATLLRREGYSKSGVEALVAPYTQYRTSGAGTTADPYRYRWALPGTNSTGWVTTGNVINVNMNPFEVPQTHAWQYPLVTLLPETQGSQQAEDILRSTRIDPRVTASRTVDHVATDVLYAMQARYPGLYDTATANTLLGKFGITKADLERSAGYIVQVSKALGVAIVDDAAHPGTPPGQANGRFVPGTPKLVHGSGWPSESTHPAIIYARTGGRFEFPSAAQPNYITLSTAASTPGPAYARSSIVATLDYVRWLTANPNTGEFDAADYDTRYTDSTRKMLKTVLAWTHPFSGARVRVAMNDTGITGTTEVNQIDVVIGGLGYTASDLAQSELEFWLGEDGLQCALGDRIGGVPCDRTKYVFPGSSWAIGASNDADVAKRGAVTVRLSRSQSPRIVSGNRVFSVDIPVFLVRTVAGKRQVITGFYPAQPRDALNDSSIWLTPFGDYTAKVLAEGLAVDPKKPEKAFTSCAGIPTNVKVKLEDELTEAGSGKDDIESSFTHYLERAREAATRADGLGEELIAQGLEMDRLAEDARDALEDLCGGVINVGRLEAYACGATSGANCDVARLLRNPAAITDGTVRSDAEGLRRCLGIENEPVNAILGDNDVCVWHVTKTVGTVQQKFPTCVCPGNASVCMKNGKPLECISAVDEHGACPVTPPSGNLTVSWTQTTKLNLSVSDHDPDDVAEQSDEFACTNLLSLRRHIEAHGPTAGIGWKPVRGAAPLDWVEQDELYRIAMGIGFQYDSYLFPSVTSGGSALISVGSESYGPADPDEAQLEANSDWKSWPCAPHPKVDPSQPDYDPMAAQLCASGADSLLCGGYCGSSGWTDAQRAKEQAQPLMRRLRNAVRVLKGVSGASFSNYQRLDKEVTKRPEPETAALHVGTLPSWHPYAPSKSANVSRDGSRMCWWVGDVSTCHELSYESRTPAARLPAQGSWYGGFPVSPYFTWDNAQCKRGGSGVDQGDAWGHVNANHCSGMREFMKGLRSSVPLQLEGCPPIPDDLCITYFENGGRYSRKCGEDARSVDWDIVRYMAEEPYEPLFVEYLECNLGIHPDAPAHDLPSGYSSLGEVVWDFAMGGGQSQPGCPSLSYRTDNEFISYEVGKSQARELVRYDCSRRDASGSYPRGGSNVPAKEMLDALDLACVARGQHYGCDTLLSENFPVSDVTDFQTMSEMVSCAADKVEDNLDRMLIVGIPSNVAEDIAKRGPVQTFPSNRGEYGKTVALLASELVSMRRHGDSVVQAVRDMQLSLTRSQVELKALGFERNIKDIELYIEGLKAKKVNVDAEIANIRTNQVISSNLMECASTMSRAFGNWTSYVVGSGAGDHQAALITCANLTMQNRAEREVSDLNGELAELDKEIIDHTKKAIAEGQNITEEQKRLVLLDTAAAFSSTMDKVNEALIALQSSHALVQGYLADLDKQRTQATRLAAAVLMLNTDDVGRQYIVNTAMRARMNTLSARYKRAHADAIRAGYLARRGVEQKLGVDLSVMTTDMTGIPAPSTWADKLCSMSGIDYRRIRSGMSLNAETPRVSPESIPNAYDYSDGFVGDYVTLLENFVDAYRIDYPFQDGDGMAVVSLRDEVLNVRRNDSECPEMLGPNLLYHTDGLPREGDAQHDWEFPCATATELGSELSFSPMADASPFRCGGADTDCADTSDLQAFTLTTTPANSCLALAGDDDGTALTAFEALGYHFRGASCSTGSTPFCEDQTEGDAIVTAAVSTLPTIIDNAPQIGLLTALRATNGAGLKVDANLASTTEYTVVVGAGLMNAAATSQGYTLWAANTTGSGTAGKITLSLQLTAGVAKVRAVQAVWPVATPASVTNYTVEGTLPNATGPWTLGLRASAAASSLELWLNGRPLAKTLAAVVQATDLDAVNAVSVAAGNTAALLVSDLRAYTERLSDGELASVQNDMAGAHGLFGSAPNALVSDTPTMQQSVVLESGSYLLSWYQYIGGGAVATSAAGVRVNDGDYPLAFVPALNGDGVRVGTTHSEEPSLLPGWVRYFGTIEVPQQGLITIGFTLPGSGATPMTMAGPQLEAIDSLASFFPQPFFPTGSTLAAQRTTCEDSYGDKFRSRAYWTYGCEPFCPPGAGLDCGADGNLENLPQTCFYETAFAVSLEEIEKGKLLQQAGFARGNFNYRINDLAVNVVGTAVKNCELSPNPSACYTNNHILYSLRQDEPFRIRNYDGDVLHAALYPGNIQQAQALLAERTITNPISSADRSLLTDYWRGELKGRPMDGNFRLRIYETDGLDWNALEDVQLVLGYRYWTRER